MKYTLLLLVVIVSCNNKEHYPKFVHNSCTGKWAVRTGFGIAESYIPYFSYYNDVKEQDLYLGTYYYSGWMGEGGHIDTITRLALGQEFQFDDSSSAVKAWNRYVQKNKDAVIAAYKKAQADSISKHNSDSIFKCKHTYQ